MMAANTGGGTAAAGAPPSDLQLKLLADMQGLRALIPAWLALLERSACNRAFSCPQWYLAAIEVLESVRPKVFTVWRGRQLAGILPLVAGETPGSLQSLVCLNDYFDLIVETGDTAAGSALLNAVLRAVEGETAVFQRLRQDAVLAEAMIRQGSLAQIEALGQKQGCYYLKVPKDYEAFLAQKSAHFRKKLRWTQRNAARKGVVVRELAVPEFSPEEVPRQFLRLHLARFGQRSAFAQPHYRDFTMQILPVLFSLGYLRVFGLFREGDLAGVELFLKGQHSICLWNGGFIPEVAALSPGKLMLAHAVETACHEKLAEVDFLRVTYSWKTAWANAARHIGEAVLHGGGEVARGEEHLSGPS